MQLLNKRTFVVWLKSMDFVTQKDATEVGNNLPGYKNVFQAMVSNSFLKTLLLVWQRSASRLICINFPYSIALTACFGVRMVFDFQS